MHNREHIVILRPGKNGVLMHTMYYSHEIRKVDEFRTDLSLVKEKELALATNLIEALAGEFEPEKYKDDLPREPAADDRGQEGRARKWWPLRSRSRPRWWISWKRSRRVWRWPRSRRRRPQLRSPPRPSKRRPRGKERGAEG